MLTKFILAILGILWEGVSKLCYCSPVRHQVIIRTIYWFLPLNYLQQNSHKTHQSYYKNALGQILQKNPVLREVLMSISETHLNILFSRIIAQLANDNKFKVEWSLNNDLAVMDTVVTVATRSRCALLLSYHCSICKPTVCTSADLRKNQIFKNLYTQSISIHFHTC